MLTHSDLEERVINRQLDFLREERDRGMKSQMIEPVGRQRTSGWQRTCGSVPSPFVDSRMLPFV